MAEQQTIKYAPQWNNMTVDNVTFQTNNVVGNFNYPPNVPRKPIMKFLLNCLLKKAFTNCPSVVYQNFLREFWSTTVAYDHFPSTNETEQHPLRKFLINFLVLNGQRPLTLDFNTFCSSTGLDYNNGKYVAHPIPEIVKKELSKKLPSIRVLSGNYSSMNKDLTSTTSDEDTAKTTPRPEGSLRDKDSGGNIPPTDMEPINPTVTDPSGTDVRAFLLSNDEAQETKEDILGAASDTDSSCDDILKKYDNTLPLTERQLVKYLRKVSNALFARITKDILEKHEEAAVSYADLKASVDEYYDENIAHRDQTDKLVEASMRSLEKSNNTISNFYKGFNIITELLKEIKNAVKDDPVINKKISETTESFTKISTNITEVLSLVKGFNFSDLQSFVNALQAHALKQDEELAAWAKSSTNMAWNLGSRLLAVPKHDKGKWIATESYEDLSKRLVHVSTIVRTDPDALIPYTINGEVYHLTAKQLQEQMDKEELIKKAEEEARLLDISKPEVIKVVQEEAEKIRPDQLQAPKQVTSLKRLKMQNIRFSKKSTLRRGTDGRNFDVHKPFAFSAFGISELDELREIIPKKKNAVVHDLMNSLSRRYERIRKIPEELRIKSAQPAPALEQASSKSLRKKKKHMELKPEIKIPRLECNRAHPENVSLVNNMVIEEPEYGIFFTDEFAASMVKSPENARFSLKLKKLIAEHPDQEKLKSKKVKLEPLRYEMN
ncbi:hypothetical protein Tco_0494525 [Tanacetum coccineum]